MARERIEQRTHMTLEELQGLLNASAKRASSGTARNSVPEIKTIHTNGCLALDTLRSVDCTCQAEDESTDDGVK